MKSIKNISEIVSASGMNPDPSFYSGRGATISDLNSSILEFIYLEIKNNYGLEAADNYIQLVDEIEVLGATAFLKMLYKLSDNNWEFDCHIAQVSNRSVKSAGTLFGTIMSERGRSTRPDQTNNIKREFLKKHGIKIGR